VIFEVGIRVENDFLIRARHYRSRQERLSMFRALVHASFVSNNVLRLTPNELDGVGTTSYPAEFFVDLIFTDARNKSNLGSLKTTINT
jgi:hypothetical protein